MDIIVGQKVEVITQEVGMSHYMPVGTIATVERVRREDYGHPSLQRFTLRGMVHHNDVEPRIDTQILERRQFEPLYTSDQVALMDVSTQRMQALKELIAETEMLRNNLEKGEYGGKVPKLFLTNFEDALKNLRELNKKD